MTTVNHPTFGKGQIVSQDENNVTVDFEGTVKTFVLKYVNLTKEDGSPLYIAPAPTGKKTYTQKKKPIIIKEPKTELQTMIDAIMTINNLSKYNQSNSGEILSQKAQGIITEIQIKAGGKGLTHLRDSVVIKTNANDTVASIADSVMNLGKCSEKQAYVLAKYALDNNISIV